METAVVMLGLEALASTGAVVYVVRRLAVWPKPPGAGQSQRRADRSGQSQGAIPVTVPAPDGASADLEVS
jgi:hypothetical protein